MYIYMHVYIGNEWLRIESHPSKLTFHSQIYQILSRLLSQRKKKQSVCSNQPCTESVFFVAEYAQKWEQLLVQQRDIFNAAIDQVSQFRGQLLQEEQISRKMTNS